MIRQDLKEKVSDHLVDMVIAIEERFDVEFDFDNVGWHELEDKITDHLKKYQILSEEEIRENDLLNHADDLSDEDRGR
tara:strand:- start:1176 stop:1409 length:234 start_codon:yes stop_codon:yes gene_type:complete